MLKADWFEAQEKRFSERHADVLSRFPGTDIGIADEGGNCLAIGVTRPDGLRVLVSAHSYLDEDADAPEWGWNIFDEDSGASHSHPDAHTLLECLNQGLAYAGPLDD